jgi:hypothetical protein
VASTVRSVYKLKKDLKSIKKAFTTVNTQLALLKEADYNISDSERDEEALHFQMDEALQLAQVVKGFEPRIVKLFKKKPWIQDQARPQGGHTVVHPVHY